MRNIRVRLRGYTGVGGSCLACVSLISLMLLSRLRVGLMGSGFSARSCLGFVIVF